jgi:hypothetical protein
MRHSGGLGKLPRFVLQVCCAVEDHARFRQRGIGAELPDKLEPIHSRHENVGDDEVGKVQACLFDAFRSVRSFENAMIFTGQDQLEKLPIRRPVVNNQDSGHATSCPVSNLHLF